MSLGSAKLYAKENSLYRDVQGLQGKNQRCRIIVNMYVAYDNKEELSMGDKMPDKKTVEELAFLVALKAGPGEDLSSVTSKVISNYYGAKKSIVAHFEEAQHAAKEQAKAAKAKKHAASKKKDKDQPKSTKPSKKVASKAAAKSGK